MKSTHAWLPRPSPEWCALTGLVLAFWTGPLAGAGAEVRVGVAAVDITPPAGMPLAGYYHARAAEGTLDPLYCRALVLESGDTRVALVSLDLIEIPRAVTDAARAQITRDGALPGDHVLVSATHAHTGPVLAWPNQPTAIPGEAPPAALAYTTNLPVRIAAAVRQALERRVAARVSVARGRCEDLTFNRRYILRDGSVGWNPGKLNPNIVRPAGPSDPEVGVLYVEKPDATGPSGALATWVNFAMHTDTTGGRRFSADWPGALARVLAGYHGPEHQTLVGLGACGNLNHLDFAWPWPQSGPAEQHRIATILGAAVFQACKRLQPLPAAPLRARSVWVELDLPPVSEPELAEARQMLASVTNDAGGNFMKLVRAHRVMDLAARNGRPHRVEVQAIAWGRELAWVGLPGEIFVELGLALKQRSPFPHTFVVELANENVGYVPDRRSFLEGNYEPESARCAPGSGERLVEAAVGLLSELHAE
jgi:neutral ceramidase